MKNLTTDGYKIHPKWNKIYCVTEKSTKLSFPAVIVTKNGKKSVLISKLTESVIQNFDQCKQEYEIELSTDQFPFITDSPSEFMEKNLWETESFINRQIMNRK